MPSNITPLFFFSSNISYFGQKQLIKVQVFEIFECSGENLQNPQCHFPNYKQVFLQILHGSSVSWKTTSRYFFRSKIIYFPWKGPIKVQMLKTFKCSDQNSQNSCQFWNKKLVFLQILHVTSLYFFLAEIVYNFNKRNQSIYKFGKILLSSWNFPEILHFDGLLL